MNNVMKLGILVLLGAFLAGCAGGGIKTQTVLCSIVGAGVGTGIAVAATEDEAGAYAAGAVLGAAAGYLLCREKEPEPKPAPPPAPKPAPKPVPPKDSDGDGVIDALDKCPRTPAGVMVNSDGCPEVDEKLISLEGVNFATNSARIMRESEPILNKAVMALNDASGVHVRVEGHTDSRGAAAYNEKLSQKRAESVVAYLVSKGISSDRLSPVGYGESAPIAPNDTAENMYKNRRVDLVVTEN